MTDYWNLEIRRVVWVIGSGIVLGLLSGHWALALLAVSFGYIGWTLFKLRQLQRWLINGQNPDDMPDSDGAWEQIAYLIHKAQQKSANRKQKQQELLMRFNNILSVLPDAAILLDGDNHIQWANKSAAALLAINEKTDIGQRIDNLVRNPCLHNALVENSDKEIRFTAPRNDNLTLQARLLPVQGGLRLLNVRDISQRIQLQKTRKAFIANASHELRTPLTVLMGYMELFESDPELPMHLIPPLQQSREQAERMQQIINDMLALSRLENQEMAPLSGKKVVMDELLESAAMAIRDTFASDTHTLETQIEPGININGIEKDIASVVTNLLANAVRHTPPGTHIRLVWKRKKSGHACLYIEDDGPGIPKAHIPHLTERFYRVDNGRARESGGTGLGLAIVKHVMQHHNGYLTIKSKPGFTYFQACFPPFRVL
ncbi:MAG: phosphate regulon sensor histidine kinase PhoR [Thiothrix sp.]|uniref:phosphate regulon sensor histidine kinase PhoR n=1 Tax=Thiothrix sp. TaxID=1032 RepID=UPI00262107FF|nr:phosphate regulon sensor histidine kinase PhoR [Thiothrix sp.]MDD5392947.1 phosphate regulon sensor histidine kinase PhoR [Thiothrix sp.]